MTRTIESTFLDSARTRLCIHLTGQIRTCLAALKIEQIWWRPNESSNAIGNLVLHCVGSTRFYIGHVVGKRDFVRDRQAEFAERRELPAAELLARLDMAIREADDVLAQVAPESLLELTERTPKPMTLIEAISLQLAHYALHAGQIAYATKLLDADAIHEIWRTTPGH
ncbi:MAG: DUF1572 family protein [Gammaproteobacteria bacterium]|nr:DUF1572 family protein [Gammaproteobacteria bacterium]